MPKVGCRMVRVNSLAVAKRWLKEMREARHPIARKRIGIWEMPFQGSRAKSYTYSSGMSYIVGNQASVEIKVSNLGKRLDV
tara:strand:- start:113 stop:355 length:243 start_codon:yes stop_codon:yes gene_type:complete